MQLGVASKLSKREKNCVLAKTDARSVFMAKRDYD